jgi:hypothetical protein
MPRILDAASQFKTATKRIEAQKQAQLLTPSFLAILSPEKAMKVKGGRGVIRVMNEGIQKHPAEKPTFLKEKRSMEKSSFVKGTVCFRYV